jgi:endoglucanase
MLIKRKTFIVLLLLVSLCGFSVNYGEALQKAIYFYECQQAGPLMAGNRVEWRANATMSDAIQGGWYDAGDHVKFNLPMSYTLAMLGWAEYEYKSAIVGAGQLTNLESNIKFSLDYLASCWNGTTYTYQIGDGNADHTWWGPVEVLEKKSGPSRRPAATAASGVSAVMAETAAALTLGYINFGNTTYLAKAKQLFAKADADRSDVNYTAANSFYDSWSGPIDELQWAAVWLYLATNDASYLAKAEAYTDLLGKEGQTTDIAWKWGMSWDDVHYGSMLMLAKLTGKDVYKNFIQMSLDWWVSGAKGKTPGGLSWLDSWGSLRYSLAQSFLAFVYADWTGADSARAVTYKSWAESQVGYVLGNNERNGSYVIGFGTNYPKHPHHRTAQGSWADDKTVPPYTRHTLYGAMVGGPIQSGSYIDDVAQYQYTEVACDYNAGLVATLAKMYGQYGGAALADFPAKETKEDEFFVEASVNSSGPTYTEIRALVNNRSGWPARFIKNLGFRYFFDISEVVSAGYGAANLTVTKGYVEFPVTISPITQWSGNIYYVQVMFNDGTSIFPGGQSEMSGEVQFRIAAPTATNFWSTVNDFSYQGLASGTPVKTQYIPVYDGTTLIYGSVPTGGGETATPTDPPVLDTPQPTTPPEDNTPSPTDIPNETVEPTVVPVTTVEVTAAPADTPVPTTIPPITGCTSPVAITVPFTKDGAGTFCFSTASLGSFINSWNVDSLTINGVDFTNKYAASGSLPAPVGGLYTVSYKASFAWSHFEVK